MRLGPFMEPSDPWHVGPLAVGAAERLGRVYFLGGACWATAPKATAHVQQREVGGRQG